MISDRERRATTAAEREARKVFRQAEAKEALTDYAKAQKALHDNRERLKAERLARETDAANRTKAG
ncbi:hypothetical protein QA635_38885 [Bradyrhizobium brasilense]|uniref:hypothetical protein n=1 Tax=Bradyrhizobium brasilense TaxID=1419277 RepID=UPI0024B1A3A8|nr:hypothetical protein [Bradyrhizobium australafricanum]WFU32380.1 hypothetical protein QA635_38885 [Bradyrhizobium australafricanum]